MSLLHAVRRGIGVAGLGAAVAGAAGLAAGAGPAAAGLLAGGLLAAQGVLLDFWPVKVPVVMLHSVSGFRPDRPATFPVWCPPEMFEGYLAYLRRRGYTTITLRRLHDHVAEGAPLPPKPIVLTFDDGYLDNWVYAVPLLEKYGFTATVFVPTDFIQPGDTPRPTLADVWRGRLREEDLEVYGYLNEAEIREASRRGVLDVQSHGRTHTWLPVSDEVVDVHRPDLPLRQLRWTWWNRFPERKPFWFHEISARDIPWGAPVYRSALALSAPAVRPDPGLEERLVAHVAERGGEAFFRGKGWREEVGRVVAEWKREHPDPFPRETAEQFRERLREELTASRERLEALTGREVRFMCWPNGGVCREAFDLLGECGYLAATLPSRAKQPRNHRGTRPDRIGRISATSYFRGSRRPFPWVLSFALKVERNRGNRWMELPIKAIWLWRRFVPAGGSRPIGAEG